MPIKYDNVIVFGPTGATGVAAAQEASARGAKVWMAMRDPNKAIKGLDESSGKFERVKADLSDPPSVAEAVKKSGAKSAYIYQVHQPDAMKATVNAFKEAGIEHIVLLSSFTISADENPRDIKPDSIIPYAHASVEVTIEDSGLKGTFLRPGAFAYNIFQQNLDRSTDPWTIKLPHDDRISDGIVPADIGRVGGARLVEGPEQGQTQIIYLMGPELLDRSQQAKIAADFAGKELKVIRVDQPEFIQNLVKKGLPEFIATYLAKVDGGKWSEKYYSDGRHEASVANVKKYSGRDATKYKDFVKQYLEST